MARWGRTLVARRIPVLVLAALALLASVVALVTVGPALSSDGFIDEAAESARVDAQLADEFGRGGEAIVFLFDADRPVAEPAVREAVEAALAPLGGDPRVTRVLTT